MSSIRDDERFDAELTAFLDDEAARVDELPGIPSARIVTTRVARRVEAPPASRRSLAALAVATLLVVTAAWVITGPRSVDPRPATMLEQILARGSIRIAVRPDFPQSVAGGLGGFDLDVANELTRRFGVRSELVLRPPDEMVRPEDLAQVDIALPSDARLTADEGIVAATSPYYQWPVLVAVADSSTFTTVPDLAGSTVCAAVGSAGADWLAGGYGGPSSTTIEAVPPGVTVRHEPSDRACLDALLAGEVDALVTTTLHPADLAARPVRTLGGPVLTEPRSILAQRAGTDAAGLIAEVDRVLSGMRSDGSLVGFSQNRFGGRDLTVPTTP
jgi:ABC-type amino acid transport substrate-binding protein